MEFDIFFHNMLYPNFRIEFCFILISMGIQFRAIRNKIEPRGVPYKFTFGGSLRIYLNSLLQDITIWHETKNVITRQSRGICGGNNTIFSTCNNRANVLSWRVLQKTLLVIMEDTFPSTVQLSTMEILQCCSRDLTHSINQNYDDFPCNVVDHQRLYSITKVVGVVLHMLYTYMVFCEQQHTQAQERDQL